MRRLRFFLAASQLGPRLARNAVAPDSHPMLAPAKMCRNVLFCRRCARSTIAPIMQGNTRVSIRPKFGTRFVEYPCPRRPLANASQSHATCERRRPDRRCAPRRRASHLESQRSIDDSAPGIISTAELQRFVSQRSPLECATVATRKTHAHSESLQPSSNVDSAIEPHAQSRTNS